MVSYIITANVIRNAETVLILVVMEDGLVLYIH